MVRLRLKPMDGEKILPVIACIVFGAVFIYQGLSGPMHVSEFCRYAMASLGAGLILVAILHFCTIELPPRKAAVTNQQKEVAYQ